MIRCPKCKEALHDEGKSLVCSHHHTFDKAKSGYVNLSLKQKSSGDNKAMVQARTHFLEQGYYDFLRQNLYEKLALIQPAFLLDLGCGQGYYTKRLAGTAQSCMGVDLSKEAVLYASKHDSKTLYAVASIYDLPLFDESVDAATSIFTPIPGDEVVRVLKENGVFITVTPAKDHLLQLKEQLYDSVYLNDEPNFVHEGLVLEARYEISATQMVNNVWDLFEMTPYRYKTSKEACEKIVQLSHLECTFSFIISIYRKESQHVKHIQNPY